MIKQKTFSETIGTPKQGLDLFCNVSIDGQHVMRLNSESFVGTLMRDLHRLMSGSSYSKQWQISNYSDGEYIDAVAIDWMRYDVDGKLEIGYVNDFNIFEFYDSNNADSNVDSLDPNSGEDYYVMIHGGTTIPELNGLWKAENYYSENGDYWFTLSNAPTGLDLSAYTENDANASTCAKREAPLNNYNSFLPFFAITPAIGIGNAPVSIRDIELNRPYSSMVSKTQPQVSAVVTDQESSVFTISRSFTNDTGADISITEFGLKSLFNPGRSVNRFGGLVYARDVLQSALNLPNTKTLTLDYELQFNLSNFNQDTDTNGTNGGLLEPFVSTLREISSGVADFDIFTNFRMAFGGAAGNPTDSNDHQWLKGHDFGIRVGASNKYVSMTDTDLSPDADAETPYDIGGIKHGSADGELYHHGVTVEDLIFDDANNEAYIVISRVFENRGATAITVKEVGVYANISTSPSYVPTLIARKALHSDDQFTIQPGELRKVNYNVKMVV